MSFARKWMPLKKNSDWPIHLWRCLMWSPRSILRLRALMLFLPVTGRLRLRGRCNRMACATSTASSASRHISVRPHAVPDLPSALGKRPGRPLIAAVGQAGTISVRGRLSGKKFLIDSGADECVFPASSADLASPSSLNLIAANGSAIKTFGKRTLSISFAPNHYIQHSFWIATVSQPILGADFFSSHGIMIDIANRRLSSAMGSFEAEYSLLQRSLAFDFHRRTFTRLFWRAFRISWSRTSANQ